jgi:glutamate N-acetyltransferase/amino-acid N-acetyltransferase
MLTTHKIKGGVCAPLGFTASAVHAGIKPGNTSRDDLALIACDSPAVTAATFTTNQVKAAPVLVSMEHLRSRSTRAVVLNSGNANACTGKSGLADSQATAEAVADAMQVAASEVLVCSTGRIGVPMPMEKLVARIPALVSALSPKGSLSAARAIMTSDSVPKEIAVEVGDGKTCFRIGGIAKGAGMIDPNMATMLCVVTTDLALPKATLKSALKLAVQQSFNRITIDGDMSTNDTVILLSSGQSPAPVDLDAFQQALNEVTLDLATKIVLDGEGVSRFIEVVVRGAKTTKDARAAAEVVAKSQLVKCAWAGGDPNWGRILDAVGYSGAKIDADLVDIDYDTVAAVRGGTAAKTPFAKLQKVAAKKKFCVTVDLHVGTAEYSVLTTDLTEDYVKFNLGE